MAAATAALITESFGEGAGHPTTTKSNGLSYNHNESLGPEVGEDHQAQFPIWVGLSCKLISGISKSTTCHDLIISIVPETQDPLKYVIVEKWKKMERILDPNVKILKVWKAWGEQISDVSFILRSSPTADGYIDKKSSRKVHRKRSSNYHQAKNNCHDDDCKKEGHKDAMEQLIKLVITQGEAIQAQLKKLRLQEEQIDRYEEKMHKIRSSQLGENYVVDAYLKDENGKPRRIKRREKSPCKRDHHHHHHHHHHSSHPHHRQKKEEDPPQQPQGQDLTPTSSNQTGQVDLEEIHEESSEAIKEKMTLMESIFQLNLRLTQEEERLVKLGLKIRKLSDKQRKAEWEELALQDLSQELEHLKQVTCEQSKEIEINERDLTALEQLLDDKHDHVAFLTHEIKLVDEESEILQRKVLELSNKAGCSHQQPEISYEASHLNRGESRNASVRSYRGEEESQVYQPEAEKQESCTSSCSNSSSVCVQLNEKECRSGGGTAPGATATSQDHQDNDSNSDTGISSLHSSVDESPMYVLDTLV